jgi:hypothetical protein
MDRTTFLSSAEDKIHHANALQEQRRRNAAERLDRMQEIAAIIRPYDTWFRGHRVRTALNQAGEHSGLTWVLAFADEISMQLSVRDDEMKEALEMNLSFSKGGHPALYVELPFAHSVDAGQHIEAKATTIRLDSQWSAEAFESFIQDLITSFLDDAPRHGGTALLAEEPRHPSPF